MPEPEIATELVRNWSIIQIGAETPDHLRAWRISTKEFREDLQWAIVTPAETSITAVVQELLDELESRGVEIRSYSG